MAPQTPKARLVFFYPFDELAAREAVDRGYLSHVAIELEDGSQYPVFFYDPIRLRQDLEEETKLGHPCIADPGMIVVPEITMEYMNRAVGILVEEGYFAYLQPMQLTKQLDPTKTFKWPP